MGKLMTEFVSGAAFQVLVRKARRKLAFEAWLAREMKDGGFLQRYLEREKAQTTARIRAVAKRTEGFKQSSKTDFRVLAQVPAREYFRWRKVDPDFWKDDGNLRSLRRDNADMRIYV
jgi:hypothetical protein